MGSSSNWVLFCVTEQRFVSGSKDKINEQAAKHLAKNHTVQIVAPDPPEKSKDVAK
jgi:hypothetical protein